MFFRVPRVRLKVRFRELVSRLDEVLERLECLVYRVKSYRKRLYTRYLVAYVMGDGFRASMYISEVVEVERMLKLMSGACLSLERSIIRLTILSEVCEFLPTYSMENCMKEAEKLIDSTSNLSLALVKNLHDSSIELSKLATLDVESHRSGRDGITVGESEKLTDGDVIPVFA